jgi:hypothetical protein
MRVTAGEFDKRLKEKRQRPVGVCSDCGHEKELRQLEPERLCGACLEKLRRKESKESDPAAVLRDEKKRQKKVRSELVRILNAVDGLSGHLPAKDLAEISGIVKIHLAPLVGTVEHAGHGEFGRDRDSDSGPDGSVATSDGAGTHDDSDNDGHGHGESERDRGGSVKAPVRNPWFSMTRDEQTQYAAQKRREAAAKRAAEHAEAADQPN